MEGIHRGGHLMGRASAIGISPGKREKPALRASRRRITPAQSSTKVLNDRGASVTLKPRSAASGSANANGRSSSRAFCATTTTVPSGLRKAMAIELKWLFAFAVSLLVCALFSGSRPMWGRGIGCVLRVPIVASWIRWDWLTTGFARRPWQRTR